MGFRESWGSLKSWKRFLCQLYNSEHLSHKSSTIVLPLQSIGGEYWMSSFKSRSQGQIRCDEAPKFAYLQSCLACPCWGSLFETLGLLGCQWPKGLSMVSRGLHRKNEDHARLSWGKTLYLHFSFSNTTSTPNHGCSGFKTWISQTPPFFIPAPVWPNLQSFPLLGP